MSEGSWPHESQDSTLPKSASCSTARDAFCRHRWTKVRHKASLEAAGRRPEIAGLLKTYSRTGSALQDVQKGLWHCWWTRGAARRGGGRGHDWLKLHKGVKTHKQLCTWLSKLACLRACTMLGWDSPRVRATSMGVPSGVRFIYLSCSGDMICSKMHAGVCSNTYIHTHMCIDMHTCMRMRTHACVCPLPQDLLELKPNNVTGNWEPDKLRCVRQVKYATVPTT